ncbi:MAG: flagellar hook-associated protein FlgK [Oceanospirillaceae bacterium]
MSFNLLNIGSQALLSNRTALTTVSQNIANASTEGYSRQSANFVSINDRQGTRIQDIDRATDQFVTKQYWSDLSSYKSLNLTDSLISQTDNLLASSSTSISAQLDTYFTSMQNVVDDPTSLANRKLYIEETSALSRRFNSLSDQLNIQNDAVNATMKAATGNLTEYAKSVAQLNDQIQQLISNGQPVNELKDQRDVLVNKIAELVDINVVQQGEQYNLFIGNGQPLVVGQTVNKVELKTGNPDNTQPQVFIQMSGSELNITQQVTGGALGGVKEFRNNVLNPSLNELGRIALALADETNTQHRKGMTLDNELGGDVFNNINSSAAINGRLKANTANVSTVDSHYVNIDDVSKLTTDDYELAIGDNDELLVRRQPSNAVVSLSQVTVAPSPASSLSDNSYYLDASTGDLNAKFDGVLVVVKGNSFFSIGDKFVVQPTRNAAAEIGSVLTDVKQVALAGPVRITTNPNNLGSGVASVEVTNPASTAFLNSDDTGKLDPPVEIVFSEDNTDPLDPVLRYTVFNISNPLDPKPIILGLDPLFPLATSTKFTAGVAIEIPGPNALDSSGYSVTIDNVPKVGDRFEFDYNKDGVSDNRNALALSAIQTKKLLPNGSLQDHYSKIVENVGAQAATGKINLTASLAVLNSTQATLASITGVNLDEEAARLVQYQQAYQASARVITTSQTLFDTLLQSF